MAMPHTARENAWLLGLGAAVGALVCRSALRVPVPPRPAATRGAASGFGPTRHINVIMHGRPPRGRRGGEVRMPAAVQVSALLSRMTVRLA